MLDHHCMVDLDSVHTQYLPIARFKRKMDVSDEEWDANLPQISIELRKGRRDMLRRVLEAAERLESYSFNPESEKLSEPSQPLSATLGRAIEDFMEEHSRQWPEKTASQMRADPAP
ncbi:MAG: hypothetical protein GY945_11140 [Rhodobacteraceae bacterium]|nr:hypothetical protein [Paracoccaceae bacterium]